MSSSASERQKGLPSSHDEQFKAAQKASWNSVAQGWKRWWSTFEQGAQAISDRLVELADVKPDDKVLDIATGIGEPSITAAKKMSQNGKSGGGQVVAIDISSEMLAIAKERAKALGLDQSRISFQESDAETYSYPPSTFDAVISRWGVMFFSNFVQTMQKIRTSLNEDSGVLAIAVWSDSKKTPLLTIPLTRAAEAAGAPVPITAGSMGPFRFADTTILRDSLERAGFKAVQTEKVSLTFAFNSVGDCIDFHKSITAPVVAMLKNLPIEKQEQAWKVMADDFKKYVINSSGKVSTVNETIIATASP